MKEKYLEGSKEARAIRQKALNGLYSEMFSDFLHNVIAFLNKNKYITKSQYDAAIKAELKSIHD